MGPSRPAAPSRCPVADCVPLTGTVKSVPNTRLIARLSQASAKGAAVTNTTETDDVHACFCSTAHRDVGLVGADQTSRIADRLDAGRARRHRCAEWAFEAMADRDVARREVHQE